MANIHDYLHWRGDLTTAQAPFNEVDALILAKLAYIPFEEIRLRRGSLPIAIGNAAKELLSHEDTAKIQYVAEQVGCGNNPQYFSQIFKKTVGMTPGKWASKIRSGTDRTSPQH